MTWKELKDKISLMTEEEQQKEVAVWGENMNLMKDCSLEKTNEDMYYNSEWNYTREESELEPEDKNDPDVHRVYEAGMHYIYSLRNAIKKAENKQNEADLALQSIWKHLAFSGFRDIEPNLSMTPGNEIMLEWNCSEMNANEIIDCMESAGYITPDDFIGVLD